MDSRLLNYTKSPIPVLNNISPHNYVMLPALLSNLSESTSSSSSSNSPLQSSPLLSLSLPTTHNYQQKLFESNQIKSSYNKNVKFSKEIIYTAKRIQLNNQQLTNFYNFQHHLKYKHNKLQSKNNTVNNKNLITDDSSLEKSLDTLTNINSDSSKFINETNASSTDLSSLINTDSFVNYNNNNTIETISLNDCQNNENNNNSQIEKKNLTTQDETYEEKKSYAISCPPDWQFNVRRMLNCGVFIKKLLKKDDYSSSVKLVCSVCQTEFNNLNNLVKHKETNQNCLNNINIVNENILNLNHQIVIINEDVETENNFSNHSTNDNEFLIEQEESSVYDINSNRNLLQNLILEGQTDEIEEEEFDFEDFINDESNDTNKLTVKKKTCKIRFPDKKLKKKQSKSKKALSSTTIALKNIQTEEESDDVFSKLINTKKEVINEENDEEDDEEDEKSMTTEEFKNKRKYNKNKPTSEVTYNCENELNIKECNKICRTKAELLVHMHKHSGKEPECWQCGKKCASFSNLVSHVQLHTGEKPYSCQFCGKQFTQDAHLTRHLRLHTGERPFVCNICGKNYKDYSYYKTHLRIHRGERLYKCQYCNKEYYDASYYKKHTRLHTGEKPYMCTVCGRQFHRSDYLKLHSFSHTDERPFSCHICGKGFKMKYNLRTHLKTHENITTTSTVTLDAEETIMKNTYDLINSQEDQQTNNNVNHMIITTGTCNNDEFCNSSNQQASINLNLNDPKFNSIVTTTNEIVTFYMQDDDIIHQIN